MPGPGNYNDEGTFGKPKGFTIGGKKDFKVSDVPGPGSYQQEDSVLRPKA